MNELIPQIVAWVLLAAFLFGGVRVVAASLREPQKRCSLCGSKDTRPVVYTLVADEWTCDQCGHLWWTK